MNEYLRGLYLIVMQGYDCLYLLLTVLLAHNNKINVDLIHDGAWAGKRRALKHPYLLQLALKTRRNIRTVPEHSSSHHVHHRLPNRWADAHHALSLLSGSLSVQQPTSRKL